jgi:Fe-S oxidoreductase
MNVMLLSLPGYKENDGYLFPLGLGYLAGSLKNHNVTAHHYSKYVPRDIREQIISTKPEIIGLSCNTFNRSFVKDTIRLIRSIDKKIWIVIGGVHATFCYHQMLKDYDADIVVVGEGERTVRELCDALQNETSLETINGLAYRAGEDIVITPPRPVVAQIDELEMPDYSYAKPYIDKTGIGFIIGSRGCPVRCTFCSTSSYWGQKVRMNSPKRIVNEMEELIARFKVKKIFFHDDTFNLGLSRVKAICQEILDRNIRVDWSCSCRVIPATEEMLRLMVDSGCRHICWGIESGSKEILASINKKITLEQIRNAFELSIKFKDSMSTAAFMMVGNQGETEKTIKESIDFLNTVPMTDKINASILYVLPGTVLYENLKSAGYIKDSDWTKYQTVPLYTVENSYRQLNGWVKQINNSGKRIEFDSWKHFWFDSLETSDFKPMHRLKKIKSLLKPMTALSIIKRYLPAGRVRF